MRQWLKNNLVRLTLPMIAAIMTGLLGAGVIIVHCARSAAPHAHLFALAGAIAGWVIGTLAVPLSAHEERRFGEFTKVLSGVVTGYVLSKFDPIMTALVRVEAASGTAKIMAEPYAEQALITVCSFGIAMLFVFCARQYWSSDPEEAAIAAWIERQPEPKPLRSEAIAILTATRPPERAANERRVQTGPQAEAGAGQ